MHNFTISLFFKGNFFLLTNHKSDISNFLVVSPCLVTHCVTPLFCPVPGSKSSGFSPVIRIYKIPFMDRDDFFEIQSRSKFGFDLTQGVPYF